MTTTKQIRAALAAATPGPWRYDKTKERREGAQGAGRWPTRSEAVFTDDLKTTIASTGPSDDKQSMADARLIANAPAWLAWCLEQIEARDALLRRFVDHYAGGHDDYCSECHRNCSEARKILEDSK